MERKRVTQNELDMIRKMYASREDEWNGAAGAAIESSTSSKNGSRTFIASESDSSSYLFGGSTSRTFNESDFNDNDENSRGMYNHSRFSSTFDNSFNLSKSTLLESDAVRKLRSRVSDVETRLSASRKKAPEPVSLKMKSLTPTIRNSKSSKKENDDTIEDVGLKDRKQREAWAVHVINDPLQLLLDRLNIDD